MMGKTLGRYEIVQSLGQGGMAEVYKAFQSNLNRYVALKLIKASVSDHPDYRARFEREAQSAARLDHPNIVRVYDLNIDVETGRPYMVMEFIEGEPLSEYVEKRETGRQPLSRDEVAAIIAQVCEALAYAHAHGVIHRDIKLGNIMREQSGRVVLTDFGLAKLEGSASLTQSDMTIGTPDYMSPEQAVGQPVDQRTDLYSLGIVFFRLLTGCLPFVADTPYAVALKRCTEPTPDPRLLKPDLPANLAAVVVRCMSKRPDERYQSAGDLRADLQRAMTGQPVQAASMAASAAPPAAVQAEWDRAAIRQLLNDAFDDEEFETLCYDHFAEVYERFGEGMTKTKKILALIDHCQRHNQFALLLETVKKLNPAQYDKYAASLHVKPEPTPPSVPPQETPKSVSSPFLAPRELARIVGRESEVDDLVQTLTGGTGSRMCCLTGMGGIGKTSLAAHVAFRLREHFSDGVLWGDVYHSEPLTILDSWARAFGCDFSGLPDLDSRAAALRNVLSDKRVLVVLDDVWSADRARPLLPNGDECAVLITTRDVEVAAALNLIPYMVEALSPYESYQLMANILRNDRRLAAEKAAADEICTLLAHLPLAVEIAAQRLLSRPNWKLADMAQRLRDERTRLGELKVSNRAVRASFELSWNVLDDDQRRSFAALGVFEGRTFTVPALAAVAAQGELDARGTLDSLVALSLLDEEGSTHYHQHPLLADYAREKLGLDQTAYARMAQYYLGFAQERKAKYAELEVEWNNIWAGLQTAHEHKMWQVVIDYTEALKDMWFARGRYTDARLAYRWGREAAEALANHQTLAKCLQHWACACIEQNDYVEAKELLSESLQIYGQLDDQHGVASVQYYLGRIAVEEANYDEAQRLLVASQRIREQMGNMIEVAETLYQQAMIPYNRSKYEEAKQLLEQALDLQQAADDKSGCIHTLNLLTYVAIKQKRYELAQNHCEHALELCEEINNQVDVAVALYNLTDVCRLQGDLESARAHGEKSLILLRRMGDRRSQARSLYQLSKVDADRREYALALKSGLESLRLCEELHDACGKVNVLRHLGDVWAQLGQSDRADQMWSEALHIAEKLQHPMGESLRERLAHGKT